MAKNTVLDASINSPEFFLSLITKLPVMPIAGDLGLHAEVDLPFDCKRGQEIVHYVDGCVAKEIIPFSSVTIVFNGQRFVPGRWNSDLLEMLRHTDERIGRKAYEAVGKKGRVYEIRVLGADLELFRDTELDQWLARGYHVSRAELVLHRNGTQPGTILKLSRAGAELALEKGVDTRRLSRYFLHAQEAFKYAKQP